MSEATTEYKCPYCRISSTGAGATCPSCGAPVDVTRRTTTSGWTEMPAIPDMTRIQMGQSSAQIMGKLVPAADVRLAAGEGVFFPGHTLLWQEPGVQVTNMSLRHGWERMRAGLPVVMMEASGPGTISFSHDIAGEMLALPVQAGGAVDVREHQLVAATVGVGYDWYDSGIWFTTRGDADGMQSGAGGLLKMGLDLAGGGGGGGLAGALGGGGGLGGALGGALGGSAGRRDDRQANQDQTYYPAGWHVDRFTAGEKPGVVFVQCGGNAFVRDLAEGEQILVKPPAFLFKDPAVGIQMHVEFPAAGMKLWRTWGNRYLWLRVSGPGRIGLQSSYDRLDDPGTDFRESCQFSQHLWK
jgi:uncharacterized protein (AIM24 family)